jgi:hypothetical protein
MATKKNRINSVRIEVRIDPIDEGKLDKILKKTNENRSDYFRRIIENDYAHLYGDHSTVRGQIASSLDIARGGPATGAAPSQDYTLEQKVNTILNYMNKFNNKLDETDARIDDLKEFTFNNTKRLFMTALDGIKTTLKLFYFFTTFWRTQDPNPEEIQKRTKNIVDMGPDVNARANKMLTKKAKLIEEEIKKSDYNGIFKAIIEST